MIIVTVLIVTAGLAGIFWMANWPFGTPWAKDLTDKERRIEAEHNRRHHRGVALIYFPGLAVIFGVASIAIFVDQKSQAAAVAMGLCSVASVGVFVAVIKGGRRRRSSKRR
ncbi:hypothetical protein [Micromonospora sp. NBC_01813]|uniref:hypothetical protein n=1 Tax=Micromonospora sp. NBC_01813 TaxID=2975988 RepID=UPI002DDC84B8|nr:hypothetical protein [Micromonospora sp. NBC_01813]WSA09952.1 hypothetical protein OG958_03875 [Micromonospora sp. NBC_01813]